MAAGTILELWRYPVKSLRGERLARARFGERGLDGDRAYAMRERATGRIVSGKGSEGPFGARASTGAGGEVTVQRDGDARATLVAGAAPVLAEMLGFDLDVVRAPGGDERAEMTGEEDSTFRGWPGSFFDSMPVHVLTTATLRALRALAPGSDFDARRFRPNVLVDAPGDEPVELAWIGRTLALGDGVALEIVKGCKRCVMTTHAQEELPADRDILRTIAREAANVTGVLARVARAGECAVGDPVTLV
jgi:uncharacterized protein YcbX